MLGPLRLARGKGFCAKDIAALGQGESRLVCRRLNVGFGMGKAQEPDVFSAVGIDEIGLGAFLDAVGMDFREVERASGFEDVSDFCRD